MLLPLLIWELTELVSVSSRVPPTKSKFHFAWFWFHWSSVISEWCRRIQCSPYLSPSVRRLVLDTATPHDFFSDNSVVSWGRKAISQRGELARSGWRIYGKISGWNKIFIKRCDCIFIINCIIAHFGYLHSDARQFFLLLFLELFITRSQSHLSMSVV